MHGDLKLTKHKAVSCLMCTCLLDRMKCASLKGSPLSNDPLVVKV